MNLKPSLLAVLVAIPALAFAQPASADHTACDNESFPGDVWVNVGGELLVGIDTGERPDGGSVFVCVQNKTTGASAHLTIADRGDLPSTEQSGCLVDAPGSGCDVSGVLVHTGDGDGNGGVALVVNGLPKGDGTYPLVPALLDESRCVGVGSTCPNG